MKKFTRTGKKVLSVFLAALMVMTAWVFVAPTKAEAAAGGYYTRVYIYIDDWGDYDGGWLAAAYNDYESYDNIPGGNCAGMSIWYKDDNGTSTTTKREDRNLKTVVANTSGSGDKVTVTVTFNLTGFPTELYWLNEASKFDACRYLITKITVAASSASTEYVLWEGEHGGKSQGSRYAGRIKMDNGGTTSFDDTGTFSDTTNNTSQNKWNTPYPETFTWNPDPFSAMTCPKTGTETQTVKVIAKDQYGVQMYDPTWSVRGSSCGTTGISMSTGSNRAESSKIQLTNAANIAGTTDSQTGTVTATWGTNQKSSKTFTINDSTYTATFAGLKNTDGTDKTNATATYKHGHTPTAAATASSYANGDYDYTHTGWSPTIGQITADTTYTAQYTSKFVAADLTELNTQISNANYVKTTELWTTSSYTQETMNALESALTAANTMKNSNPGRTQQGAVNSTAAALKNAIDALKLKTYTVNFYNAEGLIIKTEEVVAGNSATAPESPAKNDDETYHYSFKAWDKAFTDVTSNLDVHPTYTSEAHKWQTSTTVEANCQHGAGIKKTCSVCSRVSESYDDTLGAHTKSTHYAVSKEPTCTGDGTGYYYCTVCGTNMGNVTISKKGHAYDTGTVTKNASCTETGTRVHKCTTCDVTYTETLEKTQHTYTKTSSVAATCKHSAYDVMTCSACDDTYNKYVGSIADHTWEWTVKNATSTSNGSVTGKCTACGYTVTKEVPFEGHHYNFNNPTINNPTCKDNGSVVFSCTDSGCTEKITVTLNKTGVHNYTTKYNKPSCTKAGSIVNTCSVCGESTTVETIAALGHNYGEAVVTAATCTKDGKMTYTCSACGDVKETVIPATGHKEYIVDAIDATCNTEGRTEGKKCAVCGEIIVASTVVAKKAHSFTGEVKTIAATCETDGATLTKCANCDAWKIEAISKTGHNYKTEVVAPTCTSKGYTKHTCQNCGKVYTDNETAMIEHSYVLNSDLSLNPSCEGEGVNIFVCSDCGSSKSEKVSAKGHSFGDWLEYIPATCTNKGVSTRSCSVCGKVEMEDISAKGHEWSEDFITDYAATCISAGQKSKHCSRCDAKTEVTVIPDLGHELSTATNEATCTTSGKKIEKCSRCDYEKITITSEALGHDFSVETEDKTTSTCNEIGYTVYKCSRCDETEKVYSDKLGEHTWGSWDVAQEQTDVLPKIEVRKCETCGLYDYKYTAPTGAHEWNDGVVTEEPTCTEEGVKTFTCIGKHCTCTEGNRASYTVPVPATGHNVVTEIAVAATCTKAGKTVKVYCDKCNKVYLESEIVAALGHRYEVKSVENATCQSPAKVTLECSVCHVEKINSEATNGSHSYTVRSAANDISATCTTDGYEAYKCAYCDDIKYVKSETKKATGHKVDETKTKTTPATCSEPGKIEKYCSCGQLLEVTVTNPDAAKHDFSKTVTVNASEGCLKSGYSYKVCSVCGAVDKNSISVKDASGHKYKYVVDEEATCSEKGSAHFECETCETTLPSIELPMIQHTYGDGIETKKATCTEKGKVEFTCTECGNKLTAETEKTGHEYEAGEITPATCSKSGWQTYKCKNCNDSYNVITEGPLANHKYVLTSTKTKETCTVSGTYKYECSDCRASYEYTVPATGHNYNELLENKPSTCKEIGYKKYKCSNDGCTAETIVYESTLAEHSFGDWETVTEPTTDKAGLKIQTCSVCGLAKKETVSPIGDHSFVAGTADGDYKAPTCTEDGYQKMYCTNHKDCSANYDVVLPATGHTSVNDEAVPATCTSEGKTAGSHCSVCNEVIVAQQTIPAKNHNYSNTPTAYTAATCQKEGSVTLKCTDCDTEMTVTIKKNSAAHDMVVDAENSQTATCKQAAYTAYKCANEGCEHTYKVLTSNPTPHTEKSEWEVVESATCASAGYKVKKCKDCDAILETQAIPADSDSHKYTKMTVEGSHFKSGYTYDLCSECGKIANIELSETEKHSYDTLVEKVDATAYENGYAIYECECGDQITVLLPKEGCDYTSKVTKQPTCTEKGETTYTCKVHADEEPIVKADIPALGHENGTPEIKQATCTEKGYVKVVCSREGCDEVLINEETDLINHTFSTSYTSYKPSTCLEEGKVTYNCLNNNCDATITVTLPKAQHNYETSEEMTEPTCLSGGYITFKCTTKGCDSEYYEVVENATGHKFTKEDTERYVAPTCSEVGHKYFVCAVCGAEGYDYEVPATGEHTYNVPVSVPADCENAGYSYNECECGAIDKTSLRSINPLGHSYTVKVDENTMKCSRCDSTITVQKSVTDEEGVVHALVATVIKESTCTVPGEVVYTCRNHKNCEQNKTEELPLAEHAANAKSVVTVNPVCKKDGSTVDGYVLIKCASCDSEIERITIAASHKYVVKDIERSTCSSNGKVIEECSECGHKRETEIKMNLAAHDFSGAPTKSVSATCTTEGYAVYTCRNEGCGVQKFIVTAPAIGHKNTKKETKDATCEADGYERTTCTDCKIVLKETVKKATGHKEYEVVTVEPKCEKSGSKTTKCAKCGEIIKVEVLDPTGHTWGEWKNNGDNVSCEVGGTASRECTVCHKTEVKTLPKGEHTYDEGVVTPATCTENGYTTYTCTKCGHSYVANYTPKTGHNYSGSFVVIIEPTCHSTGSKVQKCIYCGGTNPDSADHNFNNIPRLDHNYGEWEVIEGATCDRNGLRQRTCMNEGCPEGYDGHVQKEVISKIGHNYGEWTVTKEANCSETGEKQRVCDRCGGIETAEISKGRHKIVVDKAVEATCVSTGLTAGNHCGICGKILVAQEVIPMKSHVDFDGNGRCDKCDSVTYEPSHDDTCLCHGTGFRAFLYKIVLIFWKLFRVRQTCVCGVKHWE